jgi:hypothetical protein
LFSEDGELKGIIIESSDGKLSQGIEALNDFLGFAATFDVNLPSTNKLYYDSTAQRVEKLKPCILRIKYQA